MSAWHRGNRLVAPSDSRCSICHLVSSIPAYELVSSRKKRSPRPTRAVFCCQSQRDSPLQAPQDGCPRRCLIALALFASQLPARHAFAASTGKTKKGGGSAVLAGGKTTLSTSTVIAKLSPSERQVLDTNKRVQSQNNAPKEFPSFVRRGYAIRIIADGYEENKDGLVYKDYDQGAGDPPVDGQEIVFHYSAYNESGSRIDSSYSKGRPAQTRIGINGLIPGFEAGLKTMRKGGQRRIVVPPELGPPTGPSTFFSAKQCEVFDVELLDIRSCRRSQVMVAGMHLGEQPVQDLMASALRQNFAGSATVGTP